MNIKTIFNVTLIFSLFFLSTLAIAGQNSAMATKNPMIKAVATEIEKADKSQWLWRNEFQSNMGLISCRMLGNDDPNGGKSCIAADDFEIPTGEVWTIDTIRTYLYWYKRAADRYQICIWPDNNNLPDDNNVLYDFTFEVTLPNELTLYSINLDVTPASIGLSEGTYWFSVMGVYDTASMIDTFLTFCNRKDTLIGPNQCQVTDSLGVYYEPYPRPWLGIYFDGENQYNSLRFWLRGDKVTQEPAIPTLASPANSATEITTNPIMIWNPSANAVTYALQVSLADDFSSFVVNQSNIRGTSIQVIGLSTNTQHYWRVNATNPIGTSDWSTTWSFTTISAAPAVPVLQSPATGATGIARDPDLTWNAAIGADTYTLQVSVNQDLSTPVIDQSDITGTSFPASGLTNNTKYYWRVNATNTIGTSSWSEVWDFTTIVAIPAAPTLLSPADGATGISIDTTLAWNASTNATTYTLQVSLTPAFSSFVVNQSNISATSYEVTGLSNNQQYYWRVNASNAGGTSAWSSTWHFTTIVAIPAAPTLSSPADGETGVSTDPTLVWNAPTDATIYTLQVSLTPAFSSFVVNQSNITVTLYTVTGLSNNTEHYWRVNATNDAGTGEWSETWSFTVTETGILDQDIYTPNQKPVIFSVYPSIVNEAYSEVKFYCRANSRKSAALIIFDALGNTVFEREYELSPSRNQYQFGNWNLRNRSGRKVGSGEYLAILRATDTSDGKIEIFKTLFGVKKGGS